MKILLVATVVKTHIMEFHIPYLKMMKELGWETAVAAKNDYDIPSDCIIPYCDTYYDIPFERNPLKIRNIKAYRKLKKLIDSEKFDIIHCHTPVGAMLTRLAAVKARKKGSKVFYTAHGFHFYTGAPLVNWMLYYPVEKWLAHKTDVLITINKEDYKRAQKFKAGKIVYVPGVGIDLNRFNKQGDREKKKKELGLSDNAFVLLSVGELIPRKNHIVVLNALNKLKETGKLGAIQYLICGGGELSTALQTKVKDFGLESYVHFLGYRNDVNEIYNAADLFLFMSLQEGLPVALMEAMASGLPVICSDIRGNRDLISKDINGEIISNSTDSVVKAILKLKENTLLREQYALAAFQTIKKYDLLSIKSKIYDIYDEEIHLTNNWSCIRGGVNLLQVCALQNLKKILGIPNDAIVLLSVGEVNKNKNHKIVINALKELPNCWYVVCGKGPLFEENRELANNLGVANRFIQTGYQDNVEDFYHMADIFVFPSYREGLPVSIMEAMASGLPVVCTKIRGNCDLIQEGKGGYYFNPNDLTGLIDILKKMISNPAALTQMGNYNKKQSTNYSIINVARKVKSLYLQK